MINQEQRNKFSIAAKAINRDVKRSDAERLQAVSGLVTMFSVMAEGTCATCGACQLIGDIARARNREQLLQTLSCAKGQDMRDLASKRLYDANLTCPSYQPV